jgi:hypothetical protein
LGRLRSLDEKPRNRQSFSWLLWRLILELSSSLACTAASTPSRAPPRMARSSVAAPATARDRRESTRHAKRGVGHLQLVWNSSSMTAPRTHLGLLGPSPSPRDHREEPSATIPQGSQANPGHRTGSNQRRGAHAGPAGTCPKLCRARHRLLRPQCVCVSLPGETSLCATKPQVEKAQGKTGRSFVPPGRSVCREPLSYLTRLAESALDLRGQSSEASATSKLGQFWRAAQGIASGKHNGSFLESFEGRFLPRPVANALPQDYTRSVSSATQRRAVDAATRCPRSIGGKGEQRLARWGASESWSSNASG